MNNITNNNNDGSNINDFGTEVAGDDIAPLAGRNRPIVADEPETTEGADGHRPVQFTQWSTIKKDVYTASGHTERKLPPGVYSVQLDDRGMVYFTKREMNIDNLILFSNSISETIINEIKNFWTLRKTFESYGFLHRRGYLLYGVAGGGKSSILQMIIKDIIERNGVALLFDTHPKAVDVAIRTLREVEPDRQLVCIFEDIDAIINNYGEDAILSLLDGEGQTSNVINIATTNYPERLDRRIIARPRRFDRVIRIDAPEAALRRLFFEKKMNLESTELELWVKKTEGFTFAALTELVISVKCLGTEFTQAVTILKNLMKSTASSDEYDGKKIGI